MKILIVEDDIKIANFLKKGLQEEGYIVDSVNQGLDAIYLSEMREYDLILLDIMLPDIDGFEVCKRLREKKLEVAIIMLTARDSIDDKVNGLDIGANDYLSKPFSFEELLARIRVQFRIDNKIEQIIKIDDLEVDLNKKRVSRADRVIQLTSKEFALLELMIRNRGRILSESNINSLLSELEESKVSNIVNVYIYRLRNKIDKGFERQLIKTIRGMGFVIE